MKVFGRQDGGFEDKVVSDALVYFNDTVSKLPLLEKKWGEGAFRSIVYNKMAQVGQYCV